MKTTRHASAMKRLFSFGGFTLCLMSVLLIATPAFAAADDYHGFPWSTWIASMVNFAIFFGVILFFAGPKINAYFSKRRETFVANLNQAQRLREEAEARLEEYKARLEALEIERQRLLDEYHAQGEAEKRRIVEAAQKQVQKMRTDAEMTIEQDVKKAVAQIEQQAVNLAIELAQNLVAERMDNASQNQLVDHYVNELKAVESTPQSEAA